MKKWATVRFSYTAAHEDELSMDVDEVIEVLDDVEEGWMRGRLRGEIGVFPTNFVTFSESIDGFKHFFQYFRLFRHRTTWKCRNSDKIDRCWLVFICKFV
jgi:hypothetical protein